MYYSGSYCYVPFRGADAGETCLSLTMQYRDVGETTVDRPAWYAERQNATTRTSTPVGATAPTATNETANAGTDPPTRALTRTRN
jgi:hypothetical protein